MAKKITLAELDSTDKKKLTKVSFLSLGIVFVLAIFIVSCFACSQESPTTEMTEEQKFAYWKGVLLDTKWTVSVGNGNNGILEGQLVALDAEINYENDKFSIYFVSSGIPLQTGTLELKNSEKEAFVGTISTNDDKLWSAKFSELNETLYLTITDSTGKKVYYTSPK